MPDAVLPHLCRGQSLRLLADCALWWPAAATLVLADMHLGKGAAFRALGQPVPSGTTAANLERLEALMAQTQPHRLVFLGDLLHARAGVTPAVMAALREWRARHAGVECVLVRGNHDSHAGDPPPSLGFEVVDEPYLLGPFAMCHHPQTHPTHYVLAGHLHPALVLRGPGRESLRLPCFDFGPDAAVLPAFGTFTGHATIAPAYGHHYFVAADGGVWALPS